MSDIENKIKIPLPSRNTSNSLARTTAGEKKCQFIHHRFTRLHNSGFLIWKKYLFTSTLRKSKHYNKLKDSDEDIRV